MKNKMAEKMWRKRIRKKMNTFPDVPACSKVYQFLANAFFSHKKNIAMTEARTRSLRNVSQVGFHGGSGAAVLIGDEIL